MYYFRENHGLWSLGLRILLSTGVVGWRICLINILPKSCRLQRIVMENKVIIIIQVCDGKNRCALIIH